MAFFSTFCTRFPRLLKPETAANTFLALTTCNYQLTGSDWCFPAEALYELLFPTEVQFTLEPAVTVAVFQPVNTATVPPQCT